MASNMQSLSSSDFGSPIRINSYVQALDGSYPYYRHTFAADFNRDSVPDLVSFYLDGIEFQTNTVAREPGVLEVTQLKSLDDTTHCSASEGDTLLYKIYVKGLEKNQENANLKMQIPRFYKWNFTSDSITPPTSWNGPYNPVYWWQGDELNQTLAGPNSNQDTLFVWLIPGALDAPYVGSNLNITQTRTDSIKFYFEKILNSSNPCRSPEPVWTAPFTNTWLGRPREIFSRNSNNHDRHIITCGHADSLEFKFTSSESDTLLYQIWYRNSSSYPNSYIYPDNPSQMYQYADTISGYYDIAVASGDTVRAPYDSTAGESGPYTTYKAFVTDENGCVNWTSSDYLRHRYWNNNTIEKLSPYSVDAGDRMSIIMKYWSWHAHGPGEQYVDSITINDINIDPYFPSNNDFYFTVPELPAQSKPYRGVRVYRCL
jgi:hypothetical protein